MLSARLVVVSEKTSPDAISAIVGLQPDEVQVSGATSHRTGRKYSRNRWAVDVVAEGDVHFGTEGMSFVLETLGLEVARRFGQLGALGATVTLDVLQEVNGEFDVQSKGMLFSAQALTWLATAGARLSIDQYFLPDEKDSTAN